MRFAHLGELAADFEAAITDVYKYEGGFEKNKADSGNFYNGKLIGTDLGITPGAYKTFYKVEPTETLIRNLTKKQASPIYKANYWNKIRGDEIANNSLADLMLDIVVNSGTGMIKSFKTIANATAGKKIFAETSTPFTSEEIKLLNALPQDIYYNNIKTARKAFYNDLVKKKPSNQVFLKGWLSRLDKHTYSGAISKKANTKLLIGVGLGLAVVGGVIFYVRRRRRVVTV